MAGNSMPHVIDPVTGKRKRTRDREVCRAWWNARRAEVRRVIDEAKSRPCVECGIQFPLPAMQFDHVRGVKSFNLGSANSRANNLDALREEIAKCDVVCANCHAVRTDARTTGKWKARR